ncbi:MAG: YfhO family protein [Bacillota bacterium]|nr:YfhO family protein [Bacillota bacterium]
MTAVKTLRTDKKTNYPLKAFLFGLLFSFIFFLPFIIFNKGYFLFYGDFDVQQVPFYQMIHDAIRSGNWAWNHTTDLGANTVGSYSFYLLGSPFFWLTIPFPSNAVPYLMGPLLILKFGCASLTSYIYLRRYVKNQNFALIGSILYAFSGFGIYNIFFNHFHEAIIVFPLLLAAVDEYMYTRRRGILAATVFLSCIMNYYFFVGQVIFVIIYWILRMATKNFPKIHLKDFLRMVFEIIIGFTMASVLLVPTVMTIISNPRLHNLPKNYSALLYDDVQRYMQITTSMLFPPDIPARANFTPDNNANWASVAAWLPIFSCTGVVAFLLQQKKHWLKKLIVLLIFIAFVPVLNSSFQLFNTTYYARWFYMLVLMFSLATILSLENANAEWKKAIRWTFTATVGISLAIGLIPQVKDNEGNPIHKIGLMEYPDRFWIYVAIALLSLLILTVLIKSLKLKPKKFPKRAIAALGCVIVVYSAYFIGLGKSQAYDANSFVIPYCLNKGKDINLPMKDNMRSDFYQTMDNVGMFWQTPTIQAFHSVVPGSIMDFYPTVGVTRDVGSRPEPIYYALRSFLSCKYLFDANNDNIYFTSIPDGIPAMPDWKYLKSANGFSIYENEDFIPMGYCFDNFITTDQYNECTQNERSNLLLKALVISPEQMKKYADITDPSAAYHKDDKFVNSFSYNQTEYKNDCNARKAEACSDFKYTKDGFTAKISVNNKHDQLVFFSVPYEQGWSATVNGKPADIEKVDIGFMAVRVPKGQTSNICFTYKTPGLITGAAVTGAAAAVFIGYLFWSKGFSAPIRRRKTYKIKVNN